MGQKARRERSKGNVTILLKLFWLVRGREMTQIYLVPWGDELPRALPLRLNLAEPIAERHLFCRKSNPKSEKGGGRSVLSLADPKMPRAEPISSLAFHPSQEVSFDALHPALLSNQHALS